MNTKIGTFDTRGQLVAKPKSGGYEGVDFPDPSDPAWQGAAYIQHIPSGKISCVRMHVAQEKIWDPYKNWKVSTKEAFEAQENAFKEADRVAAEEGRPLYFDYKTHSTFTPEPNIPEDTEGLVTLAAPEPGIAEVIKETSLATNEKIDQLTNAILSLIESQKPKPKKG